MIELIVISLMILLIFGFLFNEHWGYATAVIALSAALMIAFSANSFVYVWITTNPWTIVNYAIYYLLIGFVWSFFAWILYLRKLVVWHKKYEKTPGYNKRLPLVRDEKGRVAAFIAYWPWSMILYLVHDLIRNIVELFGGVYDALAKAFFKKYYESN